jgi:hypothetical protein
MMDLAFDVDPVEFVLSERREFLHRFKGTGLEPGETPPIETVRELALQVNNYRLVLDSTKDKMPDNYSRILLSTFLTRSKAFWLARDRLTTETALLADLTIQAYESLADYLFQKQPRTP